ncbi:ABC-three component system protein [Cohnella laeviribosi]|uniref:ABC-three component system protein n=1 Tax=Cohnella laeviribosi TaxID=380174 RepID=UPI003D1AB97A
MSDVFSAVEQLAGYFYQVRYSLLLLLQDDEDREMILEQLDDVEFEKEGTPQELLQFKHHVKRKGGLSDRSTDLWKTIRIWATRVQDGQIDINRTSLTLITTSVADPDSIVGAIKYRSRPMVTLVQQLTDIAKAGGNETNKEAYHAFLALSPENRLKLVQAITIADGAPLVQELSGAIERELRNAALPNQRSKFRHQLEGWWLERALRSLSNENEKVIARNELEIVLQEIRDGYKRESLPLYQEIVNDVDVSEQFISQSQSRTYIRQLELLHLSEESKKTAIKDYYRAYEHRSRWLREDLLGVMELPRYDKELTDEWKRLYDIMMEDLPQSANDEVKRAEGKALYRWASTKAFVRMPSRPEWSHAFLTRGSYHMLADELKVGWMPDYKTYLLAGVVRGGGTNGSRSNTHQK